LAARDEIHVGFGLESLSTRIADKALLGPDPVQTQVSPFFRPDQDLEDPFAWQPFMMK
jgi:hypothetical protein